MADIELSIAGTRYTLACADGEEDRLRALGAIVAEQVETARAIGPGMSETRALLFAALFLADKLDSAINANSSEGAKADEIVSAIDATTQRLDQMAQKVAQLAARLD
ncbi:cell division protein ZapA [Sphingomonas lacunae]|uniref:Cell division protein ZapA n=1 Tax=Sphingomonas lacunae TaxID=2698828 RepID=A0A6M4B0M2_9SPHN|nr:cell division protein ZapA [Sphingomonas lacunae]QJQ32891.1 cell division protein ZapA [Sphingomonas lacunae]